jgi:ferredoxin--NADP+ reductase
VDLIIKNLKEPKKTRSLEKLLIFQHQVVDQFGWEKINASEVVAGELKGKPRIKESNWGNLLRIASSN